MQVDFLWGKAAEMGDKLRRMFRDPVRMASVVPKGSKTKTGTVYDTAVRMLLEYINGFKSSVVLTAVMSSQGLVKISTMHA